MGAWFVNEMKGGMESFVICEAARRETSLLVGAACSGEVAGSADQPLETKGKSTSAVQ